ncbi:hypothetical protein ACFY72_26750 [Streptomyces globisporus]|uniref:hypothetical protein n=1 Tax=Streptomyces albovinaceus subgroup TaxID=1482558 RepID=UPI000A39AD74
MPPESGGPDRTEDGRYVIIDGRRWRATDPTVPEDAAAALRSHLMAARRAVREAKRATDDAALRRARDRDRRWRDGLAWFDGHGER